MTDNLSGALTGLERTRVNVEEAEPNRMWDRKDWAEDQRYVDALDLVARGFKRDALGKLVHLYKEDPGHLYARALLLTLAIEVGNEEVAFEHLEWAIAFHAQQRRAQECCDTYRGARAAFPALAWNERPLVHVLVCAEKCNDGRTVVDVTKFLLGRFPKSAALPKAFLASANVQHAEGRSDLARATLQGILARFPMDPIAELARRRLRELSGEGAGSMPPSEAPSSFASARPLARRTFAKPSGDAT